MPSSPRADTKQPAAQGYQDSFRHFQAMMNDRNINYSTYAVTPDTQIKITNETQTLVFLGDIPAGSVISTTDSVYVFGNVGNGAQISGGEAIIITGVIGNVKLRDHLEDRPLSDHYHQVQVFGHPDPLSAEGIDLAAHWTGTNRPLLAKRSPLRLGFTVAAIGAGAVAGAVGFDGVHDIINMETVSGIREIFSYVAHGVEDHPVRTLIGGAVGYCFANSGRKNAPPMALAK